MVGSAKDQATALNYWVQPGNTRAGCDLTGEIEVEIARKEIKLDVIIYLAGHRFVPESSANPN
jgi:hypothetical protein